MISVTGSIPASKLIVVGRDLNGHVGTNVDGYDGVHGGYGFRELIVKTLVSRDRITNWPPMYLVVR